MRDRRQYLTLSGGIRKEHRDTSVDRKPSNSESVSGNKGKRDILRHWGQYQISPNLRYLLL